MTIKLTDRFLTSRKARYGRIARCTPMPVTRPNFPSKRTHYVPSRGPP